MKKFIKAVKHWVFWNVMPGKNKQHWLYKLIKDWA